MIHPVPKDLKGEERWVSIPYMDLYLNKTGIIYNGAACLISGITVKLTGNVYLFFFLIIILNIIAYPLAQSTIGRNKFDGGGMRLDKYLKIKFKYRKNRRTYLRN